jgi:multiple sugar transport system substrate-binding protein/sn-glycerol 3-phosphate transport system substrate-binding protein
MAIKFNKAIVLVAIAAIIFGLAGALAPVAQAQGGAYVNTFDLSLPVAEGPYAGVNPEGTTIVWWHNHTGAREEAVQAAVAQFNSENPFGITVEAISKGSYDDIFNAITAGIQTGELPEITVAYGNQASVYQNDDALVDLEALVMDPVLGIGDDFQNDMFTGFYASDLSVDHENARLGFAVYRSMEVLYYNVDALAALGFAGAPKTWDEFGEQVCKFVQDGVGTDGYQIRTDASFLAAGAFAAGGDVYDAAADRFTYDAAEVAVMPTAIQKLLNDGCVKITVDPGARSDQSSFAAGQSLFYTGSSSGIPFVADAISKSEKPFAFDIAPIPGYGDGQPVQNVYGASNSVVAKGKTPEQILASWLFLRWYTEPAQQSFWAARSNYFPVRQSTAAGLAEVFAAPGTGKPFESAFNLLGSTKAEPSVPVYQTVRSEATTAFNNILDGADVATELARLNELANTLLAEARAN